MEKKDVEESSVDTSIAVQGGDQSELQGDVVRVYPLQFGSFIDPVWVNVMQVMHKGEKKYEVGKVSGKEDAIHRQLKAILNKLTPQNVEKLFKQVMEVNINTAATLTVIISHIFDAMMESTICETYANFCNHLVGVLPKFCEDDEGISFKKLLLYKCQQEFENREREQAEALGGEIIENQWCKEEIEEKKVQSRRQILGNIQFIGELYKKKMLTERIMHSCIKKLLSQYQNPDEEDVEALCKLMSTIGEMLDHRKTKEHMDAYFDMMLGLSNNYNLSFKVRFMLKDVIDLRENKWQQRKHEGLTMTEEVHKNARQKQQLRAGRPSQGVRCHTLPGQSGFMNRLQVLHKAEKKYEGGKVRQLKAILNKLTPQNFFKVFEQVKEVNIGSAATLTAVISVIFDKALMEPTICEMYADFCFHLAYALPDFSEDNEKITFKRLLLNKCQEEFERGEREKAEACRVEEEGEIKQSDEEREEQKVKARRRMLGSIRLIGELYKKNLVIGKIMHACIKKLLGQHQSPDEEDIESLCELMSTIGEMIDHPKAKEHMDAYFEMMLKLSNNHKLSSRVRFMLKDAIDLRKNKWQQRRKIEGPKKIEEVHRDAAQERQLQTNRLSRGGSSRDSRNVDRSFDRSMAASPDTGRIQGSSIGVQNFPFEAKLSEDYLRIISISAIREYYSARDEEEVCLFIKELNSPTFYPDMVMLWVTDSFDRKNDIDRDLLAKLLVNLYKSRAGLLTQVQLIKGFEVVLSTLEDAITDSPKAAEYLGLILGKVILENVIPLKEIGRIIHDSGDEPGRLLETGLASDVLVSILEIIKRDRGDSILNEMRMSSNLKLEDFRHPDPIKSRRLDAFM